MLTPYRRHKSTCKFALKTLTAQIEEFTRTRPTATKLSKFIESIKHESQHCNCAIWYTGTLEGKAIRESAKTRNWERAQQIVKEREANLEPQPEKKKPTVITIAHATTKYYEASEARKLATKTLSKYKTLVDLIVDFSEKHRIHAITDFDQQKVRDFLATRTLSAITAGKEIERIRTFFSFCQQNDWIQKNPAKFIKPPKTKQIPRLPFNEDTKKGRDEVAAILEQTQDDRELAFILTLRNTGLRIGDAALLKTSQLQGDRIYLYTTKAGTPVSIIIPETLVSLLKSLPKPGGYFFLLGESTHAHSTSDGWRKRIKRMCEGAKITPDHPHRFRHTLAADLLMKGASVEDVAAILGNTPAVVVKHYAQWISGRQERLDEFIRKAAVMPKPKLVVMK